MPRQPKPVKPLASDYKAAVMFLLSMTELQGELRYTKSGSLSAKSVGYMTAKLGLTLDDGFPAILESLFDIMEGMPDITAYELALAFRFIRTNEMKLEEQQDIVIKCYNAFPNLPRAENMALLRERYYAVNGVGVAEEDGTDNELAIPQIIDAYTGLPRTPTPVEYEILREMCDPSKIALPPKNELAIQQLKEERAKGEKQMPKYIANNATAKQAANPKRKKGTAARPNKGFAKK